MPRNAKKSPQKSNLIPLIFTLGVIGWGFFTIDRLTSPYSSNIDIKTSNISSQKPFELKKWLKKILEKKEHESFPRKKVKNQNILNKPTFSENLIKKNPLNHTELSKISAWFYRQTGENLELIQKKRSVSSPTELMQAIINGPSVIEMEDSLIDSFPTRPKLNYAKTESDLMILDFDKDPGNAISFSVFKLQLHQLWKTAIQYPEISAIQLRVKGKPLLAAGGDGLNLPSRIDSTFFESNL